MPIVELAGSSVLENTLQIATNTITASTSTSLSPEALWQIWSSQMNLRYAGTTATSATHSALQNEINIWRVWNQTYATTASSVSIYTSSSTSATCSVTWTEWNNSYTDLNTLRQQFDTTARYSRRQLTEEELKLELEREKKRHEETQKRLKAEQEARDRAERLLLSNLTPKQRADLKEKNSFYVDIPLVGGGVERYRIDRGHQGNVKQLDAKGSVIRSFCIHPDGVPAADAMLAQKLFIEADEETRSKFWETANITDLIPAKKIPTHIPRSQRYKYAQENGLLN